MKIAASATLNTMWNSAVILAAWGCSIASSRAIGPSNGSAMSTPTRRLSMLPTGSRRLAGSPRTPASSSGLMALPRLAPSTSASAAGSVTNCE